MVCKIAATDVSSGWSSDMYVFGPCRTEGKRGLRRSLCKQAENLETCRKICELTLHDIFHACQIRKDLEVVLGSPAWFHVGISRVAAGTTARGVPTLSRRNRALAGRVPSSWLLRSGASVSAKAGCRKSAIVGVEGLC